MKTADALAYFGSAYNLAKLLRIKHQSIALWGEQVPDLRQFQIEELSGGDLTAEPRLRPWENPS